MSTLAPRRQGLPCWESLGYRWRDITAFHAPSVQMSVAAALMAEANPDVGVSLTPSGVVV